MLTDRASDIIRSKQDLVAIYCKYIKINPGALERVNRRASPHFKQKGGDAYVKLPCDDCSHLGAVSSVETDLNQSTNDQAKDNRLSVEPVGIYPRQAFLLSNEISQKSTPNRQKKAF